MYCFVNYGQTLSAENNYLKLINTQNNKYLIKDNFRNAELCADSLLFIEKNNNTLASDFFLNLSESYFIVKKYDYALFSIIRQRILFPCKKLETNSNYLMNSIISKYKKEIDANEFLNQTKFSEINKFDEQKKILLLIELSFKIKSKSVNDNILYIVQYFQTLNNDRNPLWLEQWKLYNYMELTFKKQLMYVDFSEKGDSKLYSSIDDLIYLVEEKNKGKILKKSYNYHIN